MRTLIIFIIFFQLAFAQQFDESHLKCSRSKTAKAMIANYTTPTTAQCDYDVTYYDIDLKIDPATETILGKVGIKGNSLVLSLEIVELDLYSGLTVESVKNEQGDDLNYMHSSNLLSITLNNPTSTGNNFTIIIDYEGKPGSSGFGSFGFHQHGGESMIWSLSEPYGARDWWPCKDTPNDKADSVDISLEVPTELIAASNGKLVGTEINGNWSTYHWQERYPIATYLVSVAIHPYTVFSDWYKYSPTDSMRLEYYVFPDNYNTVQTNYGLTKDMIAAMADRFGEYPFINEKYGHAEFVAPVGGMEHQTLTSLVGHREGLIAHELGHQWWGDMVTCANFHHIWLNEGFATYSEALWYEKRDNDIQSLHSQMERNKNWYGFKSGTIYVEDTKSVASIFNGSLSYAKASWVLHMLRHIVGDETFFNGLKEYGDRYRFKSAVTEQFQAVMEEISGKDLDSFFKRWIYGEHYPIYNVIYNYSSDDLILLIEQTQPSEVFEMPIDIKATFTDNSEQFWVVQNNARWGLYTLPLSLGKTIESIELDPNEWILRKVEGIRVDTTGAFVIVNGLYLYPVYPNPFNASVTIRFTLENEGKVQLNIFDINGNRVWHHSTKFSAGTHFVKWNGKNILGDKVSSGTYIIEVNNGTLVKTEKMLLLR